MDEYKKLFGNDRPSPSFANGGVLETDS